VSRERPINADVPAPEAEKAPSSEREQNEAQAKPAARPKPTKAPPPGSSKRGRRPVPGALKLVVGLALLGIAFLLAAVIGGGGGASEDAGEGAPAPVVEAPAGDGAGEAPSPPTADELGFPSFATGNTTRVGGADPASNAAAVALAVFPSTAEAQRPAAVTLVDEDDWAGGIAAAVLMAAPVRAPILIGGDSGLPDPSEEALAALDPEGSEDTGGSAVFGIGVSAPSGRATMIAAGPPAAEAAAIAALRDRLFGSPPEHVVIAPEARPDLAMPAAAWAARSGDPVLFSGPNKLPKATAAELRRHPDIPVYVLGPSSEISSDVVREIAAIADGVKRVSGEDPVANAIAFARYSDGSFGWNINDPGHGFVLARSDSPLDAAAAAPLSASGTWGPLLLTDDAASLPTELRSYLLDVKPGYTSDPTRAFYNHVWVIGDEEAIGVAQQAEVNELAELAKIGAEP
jgi:putative cell wall binding repeat protein